MGQHTDGRTVVYKIKKARMHDVIIARVLLAALACRFTGTLGKHEDQEFESAE